MSRHMLWTCAALCLSQEGGARPAQRCRTLSCVALVCRRVGKASIEVRGTPLAEHLPAVSLSSLLATPAPAKRGAVAAGAAGAAGVYSISLAGPQGAACRPGPAPTPYVWTVRSTNGSEIRDLDLFLAAPMHLLVAASDLSYAAHAHGEPAAPPSAAAAKAPAAKPAAAGAAAPMLMPAAAPTPAAPVATAAGESDGAHAAHGRRLLLARAPAARALAASGPARPPPAAGASQGAGGSMGGMDMSSIGMGGMGMSSMTMGTAPAAGAAGAMPPAAGGATAGHGAPAAKAAPAPAKAGPAPAAAGGGQSTGGGSMAGMDMADFAPGSKFGPSLSAGAVMPKAGVYALVAQMRRGRELILAPFYVDCAGAPQAP